VRADHLLAEVKRDLKPDGLPIIMSPNLISWINRLLLLLEYQLFQAEVSFKYSVGKPKIIKKA
jgi:hypothetical protein